MACVPTWPNIERFKVNNKFINIVSHFGISKSAMFFIISIVRVLNNYPKMKRSCLEIIL